jgi:hypothetical protein
MYEPDPMICRKWMELLPKRELLSQEKSLVEHLFCPQANQEGPCRKLSKLGFQAMSTSAT